MNKSLQEQSPECLHEYWGGSCKSCGKPHPNFKSTQEPSKSTQELIEEKINGVNDEFSNGKELIELCTNEEIDGVLLKIKNYLRQSLQDIAEKEYEKGFDEAFLATNLLWERMSEWRNEWGREHPKEGNLRSPDALKLIEWKMEKEYRRGAEEAIEAVRVEKIDIFEPSIEDYRTSRVLARQNGWNDCISLQQEKANKYLNG